MPWGSECTKSVVSLVVVSSGETASFPMSTLNQTSLFEIMERYGSSGGLSLGQFFRL